MLEMLFLHCGISDGRKKHYRRNTYAYIYRKITDKTRVTAKLQLISYFTTSKLSAATHDSRLLLQCDCPKQRISFRQALPFIRETLALCFIQHSNKCTALLFPIDRNTKKLFFLRGRLLNRQLSKSAGDRKFFSNYQQIHILQSD